MKTETSRRDVHPNVFTVSDSDLYGVTTTHTHGYSSSSSSSNPSPRRQHTTPISPPSSRPSHLKLSIPSGAGVNLSPDGNGNGGSTSGFSRSSCSTSSSSPSPIFNFTRNSSSNSKRSIGNRSLSWRSLSSTVSSPPTFDASELEASLSRRKRCQRRLSTYLHTHVVLIIVCTLSILDAVCVIGQLICDILIIKEKLDYFEAIDEKLTKELFNHIPHLNQSEHDAWNLHAILSQLTGSDTHGGPHQVPVTTPFNFTSGPNASHPHTDAHFHHVVKRSSEPQVPGHEAEHGILYHLTHAFHLGSMVILSCLLIEVFDAVVVAISWSLDVAFSEGIWAQPGTEAATMLIYLLPWRVVRIVNSFVLVIQEKDHVQLKIIKQRLRLSVKKSKEFTTKNSFLRHEVKALAGLCRKLGATEPEITACSPSGKAIRRSSVHSALERAASLTFISTMSSLGSVPSLFDMVESSSDEEDVRDLHPSSGSALKSTLSSSTQDSGSVAFSVGTDVLDSPSSDNASNCTSTSVSEEGSPRRKRGLADLMAKESVSRTGSMDSQPPSYHIATLDNDTRL